MKNAWTDQMRALARRGQGVQIDAERGALPVADPAQPSMTTRRSALAAKLLEEPSA
jgi:hypothetical protein